MLWRWAFERSMFANAHFRGKDEAAFLPDDFLGTGNRDQRSIDIFQDQQKTMQANIALSKIVKGAPPTEDIPDWARN